LLYWYKSTNTDAPLLPQYDYTSAGAVKTAAKVTVCDAKNATLKATLLGHTATVSALAVMPDEGSGGGGELLSASWDKTIRLWDGKTLELKRVLAGLCRLKLLVYEALSY
jgi:WD40 repeat protein